MQAVGVPCFTDQHRDAETGLDYFGARYYDSWIGRFDSQDPELISAHEGITFGGIPFDPQSFNAYSYALNRPTVMTDRNGEHPIAVGAAVLAVGYVAYKFYSAFQSAADKAGAAREARDSFFENFDSFDAESGKEAEEEMDEKTMEALESFQDLGLSTPGTSLSGPVPSSPWPGFAVDAIGGALLTGANELGMSTPRGTVTIIDLPSPEPSPGGEGGPQGGTEGPGGVTPKIDAPPETEVQMEIEIQFDFGFF